MPQLARKTRLAKLLKQSPPFGTAYIEHLKGDGAMAFERACQIGLEGIVSEQRDDRYIWGRGKAWLKTCARLALHGSRSR